MTSKPPIVRLLLIAGLFVAAVRLAPAPTVPHLSLALTTPHFSLAVTL